MARPQDIKQQFAPLPWMAPALLALLLLALAIPAFAAQLYALPAKAIVKRVSDGDKSIGISQLHDAAARFERAIAFAPANRTHYNSSATLALRLSEQYRALPGTAPGTIKQARAMLIEAQDKILTALKAAPADANLWYLLAEVRNSLKGPDRASIEYLTMSYHVGPREGWMSRRRLGFALKLWPMLNQTQRQQARGDIRNLWTGQYGNKWGEFRIALVKLFLASSRPSRQIIAQDVASLGDMKMFQGWLKKYGGSADLNSFLN